MYNQEMYQVYTYIAPKAAHKRSQDRPNGLKMHTLVLYSAHYQN